MLRGVRISTCRHTMRLSITSTTGNPVELTVHRGETVEGLRAHISRKLRLQTDRIVLLHRDRQLTAGKLFDLGVADGSKLTLVPVIEAGQVCSTAKTERSMMDVLESLTEVQISDFLSGRSPLTVNLGLGMSRVMNVQLQLSEQNVAELQQHHREQTVGSSSDCLTGLNTAVSHPDSAAVRSSSNTAGSTTSPPATNTTDTTSLNQFSPHRPRISCNSIAPPNTSHSSTTALAVNCHHCSSPHQSSCPPNSKHSSSLILPSPSLPSGYPHPSSLLQAATPVCCSHATTASIPGPCSPASASTFQPKESKVHASSTTEPCKQQGAVIESFVNHSSGVISGTFSGTLVPCSQSSISHPRNGISIILQILTDLLRAACQHQWAPPAPPPLHCPGLNPLHPAEQQSQAKIKTLVTQRAEHSSITPGEESHPLHSSTLENQELHNKLERLQFLMHQRRLRRRTRRNSHLSQMSHLYQRRPNHP